VIADGARVIPGGAMVMLVGATVIRDGAMGEPIS